MLALVCCSLTHSRQTPKPDIRVTRISWCRSPVRRGRDQNRTEWSRQFLTALVRVEDAVVDGSRSRAEVSKQCRCVARKAVTARAVGSPRTTKNTHSRTCSTPASVSGSSPVREGLVPRGPRLNARGSLPRRYEKLDQGGGPAWLGVLRNYLPISMLTP